MILPISSPSLSSASLSFTSFSPSSLSFTSKSSSPSLSLSSSSSSSLSLSSLKRSYLTDYKLLLSSPIYCYTQFKDVVLLPSLLVQGTELLTDYSKHLEKQIQATEKRTKRIPDYNWNKHLPQHTLKLFYRLIRNTWNMLTRKGYEAIVVILFSNRFSDKLIKDVGKSTVRKLFKYSQSEAAYRMFSTCLKSNLLRAVSLLTVDCGYGLYQHYFDYSTTNNTRTRVRIVQPTPSFQSILLWIGKRVVFHGLSIVLCSFGFSLGVFIHPKYCPIWVASIFEVTGAVIMTPLLLQ